MDRDRDRRDDRYSNTYRPRSPAARIDSYRSTRSPVRSRGVLAADTYTPGGRASREPRPRSRSPQFRRRSRSPRREDDRWRARPRSPPRRDFTPRRDDYRSDRGRSPRRDTYDSYARSPRVRERSPPPRERDLSPAPSRAMRSPLPARRYEEPRSRVNSPFRRFSPAREPRDTRDMRRRSPSPRREPIDAPAVDAWRRRRSPSPGAHGYNNDASNDASGRQSVATSRRSSPPMVHPSRAALVEDVPMRDAAPAPRSPYRGRESRPREGEREREREFQPRERERERERSPPRHRATPPTGPRSDRDFAPPSGPSAFRNGDNGFARAPPSGPSGRGFNAPAMSPPVGPSNSTPQPPSFPRGNSNPVLAAPTRPSGRGRGGFGYDGPRDFSGPPPGRRGSAHWGGRGGGGFGGGGFHGGPHGGPPAGPRGSVSGPGGGFPPPFRGSSNSTSMTYPRTQRFNNHLADLSKPIEGGQRAPDPYDRSKLLKIEEEMRKLREAIEEKETKKRATLKEWDSLEREAEISALKVELSDQHLRNMNGESEGGAAF